MGRRDANLMSQPITLYNTQTGDELIMYAPTTAAEMVSSGEYSYAPVPLKPSQSPGAPDAAATEPEAIPIFMMSKQELLDAARQRGIGVDPKWKKSQIADVLTAAISAEL